MTDTIIVYFTGGAQHPPKRVKFDFYYMHCVNCALFFPTFLQQPWLSPANKARLLEWKGRLDLTMYASRHCPPPLLDDIIDYQPREAGTAGSSWEGIVHRVLAHPDDGHASKLVRAIAHGEQVCKPFEGRETLRIEGGMWLQLGNMGEKTCSDRSACGGSLCVQRSIRSRAARMEARAGSARRGSSRRGRGELVLHGLGVGHR